MLSCFFGEYAIELATQHISTPAPENKERVLIYLTAHVFRDPSGEK